MSALQKNKSTQTSGSVFAEILGKVKKTNFELELINIVDCFLDGHGGYDSKLVSFNNKLFMKNNIFLVSGSEKYPQRKQTSC